MADTIAEPQTEALPTAKLTLPPQDAAREIQNQLKIASAIRSQRIRNRWELDHARAEKQEWVGRTTELLIHLFGNSAVADECNDWVATILPEYAELELFIELFENEMKHRMERLKSVLKKLPDFVAEPGSSPGETTMDKSPQTQLTVAVAAEPAPKAPAAPAAPVARGALIVLAADERSQRAVADFLEALGLALHVVHHASAPAKPFIEQIDDLGDARFALLLANDLSEHLFELGCCVGRLGAARVAVLGGDNPTTCDARSVAQISLDSAGAWQLQLARHLRRGGVPIDLNKLA